MTPDALHTLAGPGTIAGGIVGAARIVGPYILKAGKLIADEISAFRGTVDEMHAEIKTLKPFMEEKFSELANLFSKSVRSGTGDLGGNRFPSL